MSSRNWTQVSCLAFPTELCPQPCSFIFIMRSTWHTLNKSIFSLSKCLIPLKGKYNIPNVFTLFIINVDEIYHSYLKVVASPCSPGRLVAFHWLRWQHQITILCCFLRSCLCMLKTVICCLFGEGANLFTLCARHYLDPGSRTGSSAKRTGKRPDFMNFLLWERRKGAKVHRWTGRCRAEQGAETRSKCGVGSVGWVWEGDFSTLAGKAQKTTTGKEEGNGGVVSVTRDNGQ